jgi:hypothetical protein
LILLFKVAGTFEKWLVDRSANDPNVQAKFAKKEMKVTSMSDHGRVQPHLALAD